MKKTTSFISVCILMFPGFLHAQTEKPHFGITAGVTFASYKVTVSDVSVGAKTNAGFTVGLISSFALSPQFSFQPSLNFTQKGGTLNDVGSNTTDKTTFNYLELPLNFVYTLHSSNGTFFVGGGPSLSLGLSGKYKITGMYEESGDIKFGSGDTDDLKPFEAGINLLTGYRLKNGFLIAANYNFGLNNISNDNQGKFHNHYFGIRLGFMIF